MRQTLFNSEPFEVEDWMREEYKEIHGEAGTDSEVMDAYTDKIEDFIMNMTCARDKADELLRNCPVVVSGTLGVWNGTHELAPTVFKNFESALFACLRDAIYADIYKEFSKLIIRNMHHDGTNVFELRFLNTLGESRYLEGADVKFTNKRYTRTLGKYLF